MTTSAELNALAERVERLDGPSREVDGEIKLAFAADLFAAGVSKDDAVKILGGDLYADPRPYTASLDAAMQLVPEDYDWIIGSVNGHYGGTPYACVGDTTEHYAATPVLALLSAALKARARAQEGV